MQTQRILIKMVQINKTQKHSEKENIGKCSLV